MSNLEQAMRRANDRKLAGVGLREDDTPAHVVAGNDISDRAVFSGFDIAHDELVGTSREVARVYAEQARGMGLIPLFVSCWCDGLLTGLMLASLPPSPESETDVSDSGGGVV